MTVQERKKQLRARIIYFILFTIDIILFAMVFHKYTYACGSCQPVAGFTAYLIDMQFEALDEQSSISVTEEEVTMVTSSADEVKEDLTCWKKYSAPRFRQLGRVNYGSYTYTFYSEKVLAGGGLKIPDRHLITIDGLNFVADIDGYICVASDDLPKGTVVDTPVGRKGKVYDCGAGNQNIDLYVSW